MKLLNIRTSCHYFSVNYKKLLKSIEALEAHYPSIGGFMAFKQDSPIPVINRGTGAYAYWSINGMVSSAITANAKRNMYSCSRQLTLSLLLLLLLL